MDWMDRERNFWIVGGDLRQRALDYEPGGQPPKEVFDVLDKIDEIAENCQPSAGAKITACADEIRDLLIGGN